MNNIAIAVLSLLLAAAVPASAGVTVGASQTLGTANYRGTKANISLDLSDAFYVEPKFSTYRSDNSGGVYYNFGARAGYEVGPFSFGVEGSAQPKVNRDKHHTFGADATFSLAPGGTKHSHRMAGPSSESNETFGYGLAGVDVGGGITHIVHSDDISATGLAGTESGDRRRGGRATVLATRASAFTVNQNDLSVFAGAKFLILEASAEVVKSVYDKKLEGNNLREGQALDLAGVDSIVQGFPDTSFNAKLKWKTLPFVRPYASYTHTTFKLGAAPSNAYEIGGNVGLDMLNVKAAYERYVQSGVPSQNYYTLGASLNF